ncbi:MAG: DUF421 domain-containing protein [Phycisphaerales bacterium JB065]
MNAWILTNWTDAAMVVASVGAVYVIVMVCVQFTGLRSLAKMSPTDFVWTIATGSILASTVVSPSPPVLLAMVALLSVFGLQWLVASMRVRFKGLMSFVSNEPVLLMDGPEVLEENLLRVHVSHDELRAKLREANVLHYDQVLAVVMEKTGDISVLHSGRDAADLDPRLLQDVSRGGHASAAIEERSAG